MKILPFLMIQLFCFQIFSQDNLTYNKGVLHHDTIFIFFDPNDARYSAEEAGKYGEIQSYDFEISMELGLNLRFTTNAYPEKSYKSVISMDSASQLDLLKYWDLEKRYHARDRKTLLEKLKWGTSIFYLIVPDSSDQSVNVIRVYNSNNSSH